MALSTQAQAQSNIGHVLWDFNGDGRSDVLLYQPTSLNYAVWLANSDGSFTHNGLSPDGTYTPNVTVAVNGDGQLVASGDFNGDGLSDLLWRNPTDGSIMDYLAMAGGGFASNHSSFTSAADANWVLWGTGDFNGDGISDLLWRNSSSGYLTDWLGTPTGAFVANEANAGNGSADNSWSVVGTADYNGDGRTDLLWRNVNTGYITEWLGTANGGFTSNQANAGNGSADHSWRVVGTGDFNGDGFADVLWRNSSGYLTEWLGTSTGAFVDNVTHAGTGSADTNWSVAQIGDFNGDGRSDILWRNVHTGYVTEWLGTSNGSFISNEAVAGTALDTSWHLNPFA